VALPLITLLNIYIDSFTVFIGLSINLIRGSAIESLKHILFLVIKHDVLIEAFWILEVENKLADALSRFDSIIIANLCLYWQSLLRLKPLRASGGK
jgi:hypothetical protein